MSDKALLRCAIRKKQRALSWRSRHAKSRKIFQKLFEEPLFRKARHIALYCGIAPEVMTRAFLKPLLREKKLYLPQVASRGQLIFRRVTLLQRDLVKGAYSIMEPKTACPKRAAGRMDLIVVPGVAFDRKGGRLGRGGGYYDRVLKTARNIPKIGLAFREQLVRKVPMTRLDVRVDQVITD